jgi:precorrin-6x reductase
MSAFRGRIQLIDATPFPSNLVRWNDVHMEGYARTWFTPKQKAELWERWKSGQWVADVARALEERKRFSGVFFSARGSYRVAAVVRALAQSFWLMWRAIPAQRCWRQIAWSSAILNMRGKRALRLARN